MTSLADGICNEVGEVVLSHEAINVTGSILYRHHITTDTINQNQTKKLRICEYYPIEIYHCIIDEPPCVWKIWPIEVSKSYRILSGPKDFELILREN